MAGDHHRPGHERPSADALVALLGVVPADLTDGEVTDALLDLAELSGRVHVALARFTASFDARSLATVDGARSVSGWVAARTELSRPAAVGGPFSSMSSHRQRGVMLNLPSLRTSISLFRKAAL